MKRFRRAPLAAVAALLALGFASRGEAASYEHIDELAAQLQGLSKRLAREFKSHYRHASDYRHLAAHAKDLQRLAGHIHEVAHEGGGLDHIHDDLHELEDAFHHVEELVSEIEHEAEHGHGHIHRSPRHARKLLKAMDKAIHHMLEDVEEMTGGSSDSGPRGEGGSGRGRGEERDEHSSFQSGGGGRPVVRFGAGH